MGSSIIDTRALWSSNCDDSNKDENGGRGAGGGGGIVPICVTSFFNDPFTNAAFLP